MGEDTKLANAVKKTQECLGKFVKKPPLTEKLLKKPPFRFLHDIFTAVIKQYGLMDGLFTPGELNSENVKEKEAKIAFLQKVVSTIALVTGEKIQCKPSKVIAGQEPERTNELLQAIAKALEKKLESTEAVQIVLGKAVKNGGEPTSTSKKKIRESSKKVKSSPEKMKLEKSKETIAKKIAVVEQPANNTIDLSNSPAVTNAPEDALNGEESSKADVNIEFAPSAPELSPKTVEQEEPNQDEPVEMKNAEPKEDEAVKLNGEQQKGPQEPSNSNSGAILPRPATTRPSSAKPRPITARPAAPRFKEKTQSAEEVLVQAEKAASPQIPFVIDDDGDGDFVVEEALIDPKAENTADAWQVAAAVESADQPQGHLISQILGTKKELEPAKESPLDQETQWRGHELARQETNKLQEGLESLVRSVNPLARLLDFLQEDIESMQSELENWQTQRKSVKMQIRAEKSLTEETLEPLRAQLIELDKKLEKQEQLNTLVRTHVFLNDDKLRKRLQSRTDT
ncbi:TRAF3-interacting protein 1 isoform X2 [Cloeon dipterum]|uniref:TRAF3-interacting protein 1 isoform X2 n=1 Tax=Cloeon dipterum TaxID=197152 RepID=UPI00321F9B76